MRVRTIFSASILALAVMASMAECQTPAEVLKKAIEAEGGAEAIKKYPAGKSAGKGTIDVMGMSLPFTSESTFEFPDKFRNVITLDVMGMKIPVTQICNGDKIKMTLNGMAVPLPDNVKDEFKEMPYIEEVTQLVTLVDEKKFKLETIEKPAAVDEEEVDGILIQSKGHKDVKLFISKKTHLVLGIERKSISPDGGGGEVTEFTKVGGYKKVDGIQHATKVEVLHDGKKYMTSEETEFKHLEKAEASEFDVSD